MNPSTLFVGGDLSGFASRAVLLLLATGAFSSPVHAGSVYVSGYIFALNEEQSVTTTGSGSMYRTVDSSWAEVHYTATGYGGSTGLSLVGSSLNARAIGQLSVVSSDEIYVWNPAVAYLRLRSLASGGVTASTGGYQYGQMSWFLSGNGTTVGGSDGDYYGTMPGPVDEDQLADIVPNTLASGPDSIAGLPSSLGLFKQFSIQTGFQGRLECDGWGVTCSMDLSYEHTLRLGEAQAFDANNNPISGVAITSASGYDYTQSLAPEPGSFVLLGLAAPALLVWRRRQTGQTD